MRYTRPATLAITLLALAAPIPAATATTATTTTTTPAFHRPPPSPAKYLGTWNYDLPNSTTMRNIAVISCPATNPECPVLPGGELPSLQIPQIGTILFTLNPNGTITGRTDQGCSWTFQVEPNALALTGPQTCFNHVIGSAYTITTWTVTITGDHEAETLIATSHQSDGDWNFVLQSGARTRADISDPRDDTKRFTGTWTYDPANPQTQDNIVTTTAADGSTTESPEVGTVLFTKTGNHSIAAHTADGCTWALQVHGNTAELQPADQVCQLPDSTETMTFWSIASDGHTEDTVITGLTPTSTFALSVGSLTKS